MAIISTVLGMALWGHSAKSVSYEVHSKKRIKKKYCFLTSINKPVVNDIVKNVRADSKINIAWKNNTDRHCSTKLICMRKICLCKVFCQQKSNLENKLACRPFRGRKTLKNQMYSHCYFLSHGSSVRLFHPPGVTFYMTRWHDSLPRQLKNHLFYRTTLSTQDNWQHTNRQ